MNLVQPNDHIQSKSWNRVISVRVKNESIKREPFKGRSLSTTESSGSESSEDIFYIYNTSNLAKAPIEPATPRPRLSTLSTLPKPFGFNKKHCNLDTKPLTLRERLRLARIHYITVSNCVRLVTVAVCIGFFIYNAKNILEQYTKFETLIFLEYTKPNWTKPPAVTICTHCVLCSFKNDSIKHIRVDKFLNAKDTWKWMEIKETQFDDEETSFQNDSHVDCLIKTSSLKQIDARFVICDKLAPVVVSMQEGHKCFTFFSDIYGQMTRKSTVSPKDTRIKFDYSPEILFRVYGYFLKDRPTYDYTNTQFDSSILGSGKGFWTGIHDQKGSVYTGLYVAIHDPSTLPDMFYAGFHRLVSGAITTLSFVKRVERLKEGGYLPRCFIYRKDDKYPDDLDVDTVTAEGSELTGSGLEAYRSRAECFIYCMWRILNTDKCANFYSSYTSELVQRESLHRFNQRFKLDTGHTKNVSQAINRLQTMFDIKPPMKFCPKSYSAYRDYMRAKETCLETCPVACFVETFTEDGVVDIEDTLPYNLSEIVIRWAPAPVVHVEHKPKLTLSEFLGTLGGHTHIWLGVSVIYVIVYLLRLVQSNDMLPKINFSGIVTWWQSHYSKTPTEN